MDFTPRQKEVKKLRESTTPPMTFREIGEKLNLSRVTVRRHYQIAMDKIATPDPVGKYEKPDARPEYTDPEAAAALIDTATNPLLESVAAALRETDLPEGTARALMKRLERDYLPVTCEVERIKTEVFVSEFERVAKGALDAIDKDKLNRMNAYQLALIAAISMDKRELLDGRPTARMEVEDRQMLPEITRLLLKEAERRGLLPETNPVTGSVHLTDHEDAPFQVRAGRERMEPIDVEVT